MVHTYQLLEEIGFNRGEIIVYFPLCARQSVFI